MPPLLTAPHTGRASFSSNSPTFGRSKDKETQAKEVLDNAQDRIKDSTDKVVSQSKDTLDRLDKAVNNKLSQLPPGWRGRLIKLRNGLGRAVKAAWLPASVATGLIAAATAHIFTGGLSSLLLAAGIGGSGALAVSKGLAGAMQPGHSPHNS